jgi:hypothetical protein
LSDPVNRFLISARAKIEKTASAANPSQNGGTIVVSIDVAKGFGKGTGFGIGLFFLGFIFYPVLSFGDATYASAAPAPAAA